MNENRSGINPIIARIGHGHRRVREAVLMVLMGSLVLARHESVSSAETTRSSAPQRQLDVQAQALHLIGEAARTFCTTPSLEESRDTVALNGNAKATLSGVVKKVADIGVEGAARYEHGHSEGVLQEKLADALADGNNCNLKVLDVLKGIIPGLTPNPPPPSLHGSDPGVPTTPHHLHKRILWVDDDPRKYDARFEKLRSKGIEIDDVIDTEHAKQAMQAGTFDLIITDLARQEGTAFNPTAGYDLIKLARSMLRPDIPIVIYVSPAAARREKDHATELGVPIVQSPSQLDDVLKSHGINP